MTSNFDIAVKLVLKHEGGFIDCPDDKGGPTKYGITLKDAPGVTAEVRLNYVKNLTEADAVKFYKRRWTAIGMDGIASPLVATVLFDMAILSGAKGAVSRLQHVLDIYADGVLGPVTVDAVNSHADPRSLIVEYVKENVCHFVDIARADASQIAFLKGWLDRLFSLLDFVFFGAI